MTIIQDVAILAAVVFLFGAVFQLLLVSGAPLAEYSWGGKYQGVLPTRLRISSLIAAVLLLVMGFVVLLQAKVFSLQISFLPTHVLVWIITVFMALNTLGNLASKSPKEKRLMTPQTLIACVACLFVSIFS